MRYVISLGAVYFISLLQVSFLPHFFPSGFVFPVVTALVLLIALLERADAGFSLFIAFGGGFVMDIFSQKPFGFWMFALGALTLMIQVAFTRYVQFPFFQKF